MGILLYTLINELWAKGYNVSRGKVRRLMWRMGIEALYVKPKLSWSHPKHANYPYLLRDIEINRANQVWCADITYIPMARGFCYLVAVMDWSSRMALSWRLSNTLDSSFCVEAMEEAIAAYGRPEIFNTDQGSQFTAETFTDTLQSNNISISMDGKGRWMDNVFIERLWKSVKYEDIYLKSYGSMTEARRGFLNTSDSTTKKGGIKTLTGRHRVWFTSTLWRRNRMRHEHQPRAALHL